VIVESADRLLLQTDRVRGTVSSWPSFSPAPSEPRFLVTRHQPVAAAQLADRAAPGAPAASRSRHCRVTIVLKPSSARTSTPSWMAENWNGKLMMM
jgi:hypothetical protein